MRCCARHRPPEALLWPVPLHRHPPILPQASHPIPERKGAEDQFSRLRKHSQLGGHGQSHFGKVRNPAEHDFRNRKPVQGPNGNNEQLLLREDIRELSGVIPVSMSTNWRIQRPESAYL